MSDFDRRSGIGASMSPAIMGLSPWSSPLGAYLWYTRQIEDTPPTEAMLLGIDMEDGIKRAAERRLGCKFVKPQISRHPTREYIYASPDGMKVYNPSDGFEAKNVGSRHASEWGDDGTTDIPDYVAIQVQHQAAVFGFEAVYVAALLCGQELRIYRIPREQEAIDIILDACAEFWRRVTERDPPPPDWRDSRTPALIQAMHKPSGIVRHATEEEAATLVELLGLRERCSDGEKLAKYGRDVAQAKAVEIMRDAGELILPDGTSITRRVIQRDAYEVKAGLYVRFGVKRPKQRPDGKPWGQQQEIKSDNATATIVAS